MRFAEKAAENRDDLEAVHKEIVRCRIILDAALQRAADKVLA